jgi:hypothetical protein
LDISNIFLTGDYSFLVKMNDQQVNQSKFCLFCDIKSNEEFLKLYNEKHLSHSKIFSNPNIVIILDILHLKINFMNYILQGIKNVITTKNNPQILIRKIQLVLHLFHININIIDRDTFNCIEQHFNSLDDNLIKIICYILEIESKPFITVVNQIKNLGINKNLDLDFEMFKKFKKDFMKPILNIFI